MTCSYFLLDMVGLKRISWGGGGGVEICTGTKNLTYCMDQVRKTTAFTGSVYFASTISTTESQ